MHTFGARTQCMPVWAGKAHARPLQETDVERRLRESQVVDERITVIYNIEDFRREMKEVRHNGHPVFLAHLAHLAPQMVLTKC